MRYDSSLNETQLLIELLKAPIICMAYIENVNESEKTINVLFPSSINHDTYLNNYWLFSDISCWI